MTRKMTSSQSNAIFYIGHQNLNFRFDTGDYTCGSTRCGRDSECVTTDPLNPYCRCLPGFFGDGYACRPEGIDVINCSKSSTAIAY